MRKTLGAILLLAVSVQAQAVMPLGYTPPPTPVAISLEDYMSREKKCKELGGKSEPVGYRIAYKKVVVTGLECNYNGSVFEIPKQKEQLTSKDVDSGE